MRIFIVTLALLSCLFAYADQDPIARHDYVPNVIPPSPTAAELGRYGQIPVGMFTGTPQISIPLYTMTSRQLSIPVSLYYSSNGIKVDQVASWVGLGWSLNAGGVITRIIRGQEDEKTTFPVPVNIEEDCYETWDFLHNIWYDMLDTEPDLFSFNFAGHSGSFVMYVNDQNEWDIALIPFQDLKVEFNYNQGELDSFTITTTDGIQYLFGDPFIETSKIYNTGYSCSRTYDQPKRTSWYLYKIIHPGGDIIEFTYDSKYFTYYSGISETVTELLYPNACGPNQCEAPNNPTTLCHQILAATTWHLTSIEASDGQKIIFYPSYNRQDLDDYKLDSLIVLDPDGNVYKRFDFSYYFTMHNQYLNTFHDDDQTLKHRMFLDSIQISGDSSPVIQTYGFEYIQRNDLPPRLSFAQDHWGYFNGVDNSAFIPDPGEDWEGIFQGHDIDNDREPHGIFSGKGLLNKIIYPTGGYTILEYEPNTIISEDTILDQSQYILLNVLGSGRTQPDSKVDTFNVPFTQKCNLHGALTFQDTPECNPPELNQYKGRITLKKAGYNLHIIDEEVTINDPAFDKEVILLKNTDYILTVTSFSMCVEVSGKITYYGSSEIQNALIEIGGQRIKTTILTDHVTDRNEIIHYYYGPKDDTNNSSALLNGKIIPYSTYSTTKPCEFPCEFITCDYVTLHSSSVNTLYNANGNHIFYQYVTKSFGENFEYGGEEYKFQTSYDSYGNPIWGQQTIMGGTKTNGSWNAGNLLEKKTFRKAEDNSLILTKDEINTYKTEARNSKEIVGYIINKKYDVPCQGGYSTICTDELVNMPLYSYCSSNHNHHWIIGFFGTWCLGGNMEDAYHPCHDSAVNCTLDYYWDMNQYVVNEYKVLSKWQYLETSEVRDYDPDGINYLSTTNQYFYDNSSHAQISRTYTTTSENKREYTLTLFPDDYANIEGQPGDPIGMMKEKHMINTPIETIQYESDTNGENIKVLHGNIRTYRDFDNHILLNSTYQLETSDPIPKSSFTLSNFQEPGIFPPDQGDPQDFAIGQWDQHYSPTPLVTVDEYDNYSNILQYHKENDINVTILWGYNYSYPIAKIENATYDQVEGVLLDSLAISYEQLQTKTSEELETIFQALRNHDELKDAYIHSYTYSPLIGMISETTPYGIKTTYDYDAFGRHSNIRDHNSYILKHFDYNYAR